jgi:2-oxoglutarate ferredoxin oxidoreductase subunit beta
MDPWLHDPQRVLLLHHQHGLQISPSVASVYARLEEHDPANVNRGREIASSFDPIPVGILYRNDSVPCYEDVRHDSRLRTSNLICKGLEAEFDKFTVWPNGMEPA